MTGSELHMPRSIQWALSRFLVVHHLPNFALHCFKERGGRGGADTLAAPPEGGAQGWGADALAPPPCDRHLKVKCFAVFCVFEHAPPGRPQGGGARGGRQRVSDGQAPPKMKQGI